MLKQQRIVKDVVADKILILGDKKVGKSTVIHYLEGYNFIANNDDTTGDVTITKTGDKIPINLLYIYQESVMDDNSLRRINLDNFKCFLVIINEADLYATRGQEFVNKLRNISNLLIHKNYLIIINRATRSIAQIQKRAQDLCKNESDLLELRDIIVVHPENVEERDNIYDAIAHNLNNSTPILRQSGLKESSRFQFPAISEFGLGAASVALGGFLLREGSDEEQWQYRYASVPFLTFGAYAIFKGLSNAGQRAINGFVHALDKHGFALIQGIIEKGAVSASIDSGAFNFEACIREGAISAQLEPGAVVAAIQEGAIVGVQRGGIWAGMEAGAARAGVSPGAFNAWIERGAVDAGIAPGAVKAWVESGAVSATVDSKVNANTRVEANAGGLFGKLCVIS